MCSCRWFCNRNTQIPAASAGFGRLRPPFAVLFCFSYYKKGLTVEAVTGSLSFPHRWPMTRLYPADGV